MTGDVTLRCADCFDVLPTLQNKSVDLVLADLPYGTTQCAWDTEMPLDRLWEQYDRICRGPVVLFAQTPFDKILGASNIKALRYEWIWEKTNATGHLNAKKAPMKAHENVLVFYDRQPTYNPVKTFGYVRKTARKRGDGSEVYGKQNLDGLSYDSTERYPRSVIQFASDKQTSSLHPTQKPVALCEYLIRTYSNPGDLILDNCMGSGTTGVAALSLGRRFYGIERERAYFEIAEKRLAQTRPAGGDIVRASSVKHMMPHVRAEYTVALYTAPLPLASRADRLWEALKERCAASRDKSEVKTLVLVTQEDVADALLSSEGK